MCSDEVRRQLEIELCQEVRKAGEEYLCAGPETRAAARDRYAALLDVFNALILGDVHFRPAPSKDSYS